MYLLFLFFFLFFNFYFQAKSEQDAKISVRDYEIQQKCLAELKQKANMVPKISQPAKAKGKAKAKAKVRVRPTEEKEEESEDVIPLIVKGDVMGSVEALVAILESRQPKQKILKVIHTGVGGVTDTDVDMAFATKG